MKVLILDFFWFLTPPLATLCHTFGVDQDLRKTVGSDEFLAAKNGGWRGCVIISNEGGGHGPGE